jgi:GR25 family glycosyltransferase involved in LPS biosynthesis
MNEFPPMYYINLDNRVDRNEHMKSIISSFNMKATRISATNVENYKVCVESVPNWLRPSEIACLVSHLRAIRKWLTTSDSDIAMICEDDVSFEHVPQWNFTWGQFMNSLPYYWEICQCCIIFHPQQKIIINMHDRTEFDYSAACYILKRSYAERLMSYYWNPSTEKWKFDFPISYRLTSEEAIYRPGACISIPLFSFTNEHGSNIQTEDHIETYHTFSKCVHNMLWSQISAINILSMNPPITYNK